MGGGEASYRPDEGKEGGGGAGLKWEGRISRSSLSGKKDRRWGNARRWESGRGWKGTQSRVVGEGGEERL